MLPFQNLSPTADSAVRITAELAEAATNTAVWGGKYSGTLADVFDPRSVFESLRRHAGFERIAADARLLSERFEE